MVRTNDQDFALSACNNGTAATYEALPAGAGRVNHPFLTADWDIDDIRNYSVKEIGNPGAVPITEDTDFLREATRSAGVTRQYSGTAGQPERLRVGTLPR